MPSTDILILGAGPSGLEAARKLASNGHKVTLIEQSDETGGMSASFDFAGHPVDYGSHRLHPATDPAIMSEIRDLLGDDLQMRPRHGRLLLEDKWIAFPLQLADLLRNSPRGFAARAARDALLSPLRSAAADNFEEVVNAGLGPAVAQSFYLPYARKLWDTDPRELSGELARRRIASSSPSKILSKLMASRGSQPVPFFYPTSGYGAITRALTENAVLQGVDLQLNAEVQTASFRQPEGAVIVAGETEWRATHVLSTIPLARLVGITSPAASTDAIDAAHQMRHRSMLFIYVLLDEAKYTDFDAHYLPSPSQRVSRLSEPKNYRNNPSEPAHTTVLCAEIPCWHHEDLWNATQGELVDVLNKDLLSVGLPRISPLAVTVKRKRNIYPVYDSRFSQRLAALEEWALRQPGLVTLGRQGLVTPDNIHHAMAMGASVAECMSPNGEFDVRRWKNARESFRSFVVED